MEISERRLRTMVADVDDRHRDAMRTFADDTRELVSGETRHVTGDSRRRFLKGVGLGGASITIGSAILPVSRLVLPAAAQSTGGDAETEEPSDDELATFAASVELAAVAAYGAVVDSGKVAAPAVLEAADVFAGHHRDHAGAFEALAPGAVATNQSLLEMVNGQVEEAQTQAEVVTILYDLENAAAATYLFALGLLTARAAYETAASILPVEAQHAVTLGIVLGRPVDDAVMMPAFETADAAVDPAEFPIEPEDPQPGSGDGEDE